MASNLVDSSTPPPYQAGTITDADTGPDGLLAVTVLLGNIADGIVSVQVPILKEVCAAANQVIASAQVKQLVALSLLKSH